MFKVDEGNSVDVASDVPVSGEVCGTGNRILVSAPSPGCEVVIRVNGNNNVIVLDNVGMLRKPTIRIGNYLPSDPDAASPLGRRHR